MKTDLGLYLHVPFCGEKCYYCDFLTYARQEKRMASYLKALMAEIRHYGAAEESRIDSIYIGGGTPTHLGDALAALLACVYDYFEVAGDAEVTVETNPGDLSPDLADKLLESGVNRLSLGAQSFDAKVLSGLNRPHNGEDIQKTFELARKAGFNNISLDLMYGIPKQTLEIYKKDIQAAVDLDPDHLSAYSLIVEPATYFHRLQGEGRLEVPDEDIIADMEDWTRSFLTERGYGRYEVSNYAKAGFESVHNLKYWTLRPYMGLGLGAASYRKGVRFKNTDHFRTYIKRCLSSGRAVEVSETLSEEEALFEALLLPLRCVEGVGLAAFKRRFGALPEDFYGDAIRKHLALGNLERTHDRLRFTPQGMDYSNLFYLDLL